MQTAPRSRTGCAPNATHTRRSLPRVTHRTHSPPSQTPLCHTRHQVTYTCASFLDKNRDYVVEEHRTLLAAAAAPLVSELFTTPAGGEGGATVLRHTVNCSAHHFCYQGGAAAVCSS